MNCTQTQQHGQGSHFGIVGKPAACNPENQLPSDSLGKAEEEGPSGWAPATHVADPDEAIRS